MFAWNAFNGDGATLIFNTPWPFLDKGHVRAFLNGTEQANPADFSVGATDRTTGITPITFVVAPPSGTNNLVIRRTTKIPVDLVDAAGQKQVQRPIDTPHGSSLVMGDQPTNLTLLFLTQEAADKLEVMQNAAGVGVTENSTSIGGTQDGDFATLAVAWNGATNPTAAEGALLIDAIREIAVKVNSIVTSLDTL